MTPPGQLLPLARLPPLPHVLSSHRSRCPPPAHAHAGVSPLPPWRPHRLHGRFVPSPQLFRAPAWPPRTPTPPGVSAAARGEAQAAAVAEFVTSERVKVAAMLRLALALCNAGRVVMSITIVPLSQAYGWTPSFAGVVQSSFLWGYLMSPIIGGAFVDYYGGKRVMAYGIALWSLATFLSPWAAGRSIWLFLFTRILLGLAGVALPSMNNMVLSQLAFWGQVLLCCLNAAKSPIIASAWLTIAVGLKSFGHSGFLVNLQEIAPQYAGVLHGMSNTAGTFAAILGTIGAGFFVDRMGSFHGFLILTSLLYFSSALFWDIFATGERVDFDGTG
ncbi:unnamed protein product [Miscanthus lutarioriparius]|uniref:Major facilitator superfamily (MFS) profile domain-containing protein n=1 Tax=Miscanthus lutarioriparius TaxID=422564 RepID=A0A811PAX4_9POAL|nr:unnamed protein product [Miscanthus lutarioriparius]